MKQEETIRKSLSYCLIYGFFSISYSFTSKFMYKVFNYRNVPFMLFTQFLIQTIICSTISFIRDPNKIKKSLAYKNYNMRQFWKKINQAFKDKQNQLTIVHSILFLLNAGLGMKALSILPIPIYMTVRRTLMLFVLAATKFFGAPKRITGKIVISVILISSGIFSFQSSGALIASVNNILSNQENGPVMYGLSLALAGNVCSAALLEFSNYLNAKQNIEPFDLFQYNSYNNLPVLSIYIFFTGNITSFYNEEQVFASEFFICLIIWGINGAMLNYSTMLCSMKNSPLAIGITHSIKDMFTTLVSFLIFNDIKMNLVLACSFMTSFAGSMVYTYEKVRDTMKARQKEDEFDIEMQAIPDRSSTKILPN